MANFISAFNITMKNEGLYSNDRDDIGGETYKGISRIYNPSWEGWRIIDKLKRKNNFHEEISKSKRLNDLVMLFYRQMYWDKLLLDNINDQQIAEKLFDISVNMGTYRSSLFLQQALNFLNRNEKLYPDLVEDGIIGRKTLSSLDIYLKQDDYSFLLKILNLLQGNHYLNFMRKSPRQEKFARGWLNRITIRKRL